MRFSIIVPAHNAQKRIGKLLRSIESQTFEDYELIVVADKCTDKTAQIARSYGADVYEIEAGNDGLARNEGLEHAVGEWVLFADDDDWWINDYALEQIDAEISAMDKAPDMIQCAFVFGYNGVTSGTRIWPNVWSKVWKREAIGDTRFPNVYPDSDLYFTQAMLDKRITVRYMPILWYFYNYLRPGSATWKLAQEGK